MSGDRSENFSDLLNSYKIQNPQLNIDGAIYFLKAQGASKIESILALSKAFGTPISSLEELVHTYSAWEFRRQSDDDFRGEVFKDIDSRAVEEG